ncbi:hypothetical protein EJ05DRAFT_490165 [Pseudovirgaria hyperparasitica]|uniref:C2H2-type domain-containing protein n=1 Tax=Pseudovirgaria hyperparasitica TaxID=470096 RepID=A0A6A6VUS2_9PEZI|nr:uncharacterized protein EJ05DRAFT_490165 [Pseudovirgaria hyperparasitica]KAF2753474.1 hypothetical protein EJ05DRAFT_490165 [Pseudovirgaria hyperparasitica]
MHGGPDPLGAPSSFTARRPNASNLPNFELPPPPLSQFNKINPYGSITSSQATPAIGTTASVGNLLTPPSNVPGDGLSPVSTGVTSNSSGGSAQAIGPYTHHYWPSPQSQGHQSYGGFQSGHQQSQQHQQPQQHQYQQQSRGLCTPNPEPTLHRNMYLQSPKGLPPPPNDLSLPSFTSSGSMSAPAPLSSMPAQHYPMSNMMGSQGPVSTSAPQQSPVHAQQEFHQQNRQPQTPTYYHQQQNTAPQQSPYPYSSGPSPTQQSPLSAGGQMHRMSPANSGAPVPTLQAPSHHSPHQYQQPFRGYPLPGPVLSNVQNPGGQLSLVGAMQHGMMGGFNSGHAASMSHMYASQHQQQQHQPTNDRPFKCDQCPQSFNRNHDLKRHKRIHLAVKPFPCGHCDKSFSRKDALKRHILVKGCGKASAEGAKDDEANHSPKALSTGADSHDGKR